MRHALVVWTDVQAWIEGEYTTIRSARVCGDYDRSKVARAAIRGLASEPISDDMCPRCLEEISCAQ